MFPLFVEDFDLLWSFPILPINELDLNQIIILRYTKIASNRIIPCRSLPEVDFESKSIILIRHVVAIPLYEAEDIMNLMMFMETVDGIF